MGKDRIDNDRSFDDFNRAGAVPSSSWRISPYPKIPINPVVHGLRPAAQGSVLRGEDDSSPGNIEQQSARKFKRTPCKTPLLSRDFRRWAAGQMFDLSDDADRGDSDV
ncbi:hypothetical protein SEA_SIXAMA_177 [Gordonia phage Sixama]|uniref:Uncharacterized protein n=1 Tax=Gordonia phage Sixama TaxID=2653271 RepID=A0A5Q2F4A7_9CAUD|nr:hypothetical protein PP302_gp152 [Gordonia phage Sixama]QGF20327.1 hypothetical protein SEA_SIXAMA_177 [Gordonia phage Sixama]